MPGIKIRIRDVARRRIGGTRQPARFVYYADGASKEFATVTPSPKPTYRKARACRESTIALSLSGKGIANLKSFADKYPTRRRTEADLLQKGWIREQNKASLAASQSFETRSQAPAGSRLGTDCLGGSASLFLPIPEPIPLNRQRQSIDASIQNSGWLLGGRCVPSHQVAPQQTTRIHFARSVGNSNIFLSLFSLRQRRARLSSGRLGADRLGGPLKYRFLPTHFCCGNRTAQLPSMPMSADFCIPLRYADESNSFRGRRKT